MTSFTVDHLDKGTALPPDASPVVADARRAIAAMADDQARGTLAERLDQIGRGAFDVVVVRAAGKPVCLIAARPSGDEATLSFGHVLPAFERESEAFLALVVKALAERGFKSLFSVFKWPAPGAFIEAADRVGFTRVDRLDMARKCGTDSGYPVPAGVRIAPWSPRYSSDAAGLLFENAHDGDRTFHLLYRTREGCRIYMENIFNHLYGQFLPELSYIAQVEDRPVGLLLTACIPRVGLDIVDLAVDRAYRGRGIASSLIGHLLASGATAGKGDVVLTVTESNLAALKLYQRMGFHMTARVGYYIYVAGA